jgi:Ca2+-binding EF-hand superfamily protein
LNTEELFSAVDKDGNGAIELHEWIEFWTAVKRAGHSEEEISQEVDIV